MQRSTQDLLSYDDQRDAAELLYGNAFSGILISIIASSFLVYFYDNPVLQEFKITWWLGMMSLLLVRLIDWVSWKKHLSKTHYDGKRSVRRFIYGVNLTALMWSSYAAYAVSYSPLVEKVTIIIVISGMAGGSAIVLAAHKLTSMFYTFALLCPVSVVFLLSNDATDQNIGVLGLSYSLVMLIISAKSANFARDAIALKNENALLVNRMEQKVEQRTQKIYELSNLDSLTHLHNRNSFLKNLKASLQASDEKRSTLSLLFIDLDGFKKVNDTYGHKVGDQILEESARRLREKVANESLLCRWGGDEFLIAIEDCSSEKAISQAYEIIEILSHEHQSNEGILPVSATVGISLYPEHERSESRLIQFADTAMYHQKKTKPSKVCVFTPEMEAKHQYELELKKGLNDAIDKDQMRLVFQPIVSTNNSKNIAFEALLRWDFEGKNIPPDEFIKIAEQYGSIHRIGAWVLKESCKVALAWQSLRRVSVCINVSVIQLEDSDFLSIVDEAVQESGIDPSLIYLEITESVFAKDTEKMMETISAIQSRGIKVSIDDFGTGYSSLSAMQDLAVNTVKIDRSFITKLDTSGFAIVTAVTHAARLLKFDVVAEGVETEAQCRKLVELGVEKLQGYYFSKPLEQEFLLDYLESEVKSQ